MANADDVRAQYEELVSLRRQLTEVVEELMEERAMVRLLSLKVSLFDYGEIASKARFTRERWALESRRPGSGFEQILSREMARRGHAPQG